VSGSFVTLNELSMLIKKQAAIASSEITPKNVYLNRRNFLVGAALAGAAAVAGVGLKTSSVPARCGSGHAKIDGIQKSKFSTGEAITPYKGVTNYDNYYEFSTDKYGPAELAKDFKTRPRTVSIEGLLKKKQVLDVDSIIKLAAPEERI
jgi:methionine sulfoxide reductase catalytic subunit